MPEIKPEIKIDLVCDECGKCSQNLTSAINSEHSSIRVCDDCLANYIRCWECSDYIRTDTVIYIDGYSEVCENCYDENFSECRDCGCIYHIRDLYSGRCEDCSEDAEEEYCDDFDFEFLSTNNETRVNGNILYFGIELEVGSTNDNVNYRKILSDYTGDIIHLTEDCSIYDNSDILSGCELVANPATYNWYIIHRNIWSDILKTLRKNGTWSYKAKSCGIHIHLSKNVFTTSHLYNFLKIIYANPNFTKLISQRGKMGLSRWSNITNESGEETIKRKANTKYSSEKYTAVNLIHPDTVEVRIFRGTLHEGSFYKNIEYLQALFEFTEVITKQESLTVENYIKYVSINKDRFPDLYDFLKSRGQMNGK